MAITFDQIMAFHPGNQAVFNAILKNRVQLLPFVGAGLTAPVYGGWADALRHLGKLLGDASDEAELDRLLQAGEMLEAAGFLEARRGGNNLVYDLIGYFSLEKYRQTPPAVREGMAVQLLPRLFPCPVLTTNFDEVLEQVYSRWNGRTFPVLSPTSPNLRNQAVLLRQSPCLFKLHGSVSDTLTDFDTLVFTPAQYDRHYAPGSPVRQALADFLNRRSLLFLGCGLEKDRTVDVLRDCAAPGSVHFAILDCEEERKNERLRELDRLHIRAIVYPKGEYDAVRVILERLLQETDPEAYRRLPLRLSELSAPPENVFHYKSRMSAFSGRETELQDLLDFVTTDPGLPFRWWAVTGPGGSGKSRLALELRDRVAERGGWDCHVLTQTDYDDLSRALENRPRCTLLVTDYVQAHARELGRAMQGLLEQSRSAPLRLLLVERSGQTPDADAAGFDWVAQLYEDVHDTGGLRRRCYRDSFLELDPLADAPLKAVMRSFAEKQREQGKDHALPEDSDCQMLLDKLDEIDPGLRRPLYALVLTDAWMDGQDVTHWNRERAMDEILDRESRLLDERIRQVTGQSRANRTLLAACLDLYRFATARTGSAEPGELPSRCPAQYKLIAQAAERAGLEASADFLQSIGLADAARLRPLEPDLLGEYFVLRWLLAERNADKRLDFLRRVWKQMLPAVIFFDRLRSDHGHLLNERPEHWLRLLPPPEALGLRDDAASALWYAMLTVNAIAECSHAEICRELTDRLAALHGAYPGHAEIALEFAKGLVNLSATQDAAEAAGTVERLAALHRAYPGQAEIALEFAKGLVNLSTKQNAAERAGTVARLEALHGAFPGQAEIALEFAKGLFNLSLKQDAAEAAGTVARLEALHGAYPGQAEIALEFAKGLVNLSAEQDAAEAAGTVERLAALHGAFPGQAEIALVFAMGLGNLCLKYFLERNPEEAVAILNRLVNLHEQHPDNAEITQVLLKLLTLPS
ncbi:MAG: SIR2 family protein [Oscillospiraceae bacterium]|nr:SIR2 family protein [Oscillospiraceae bacterium]